MSKILISYRRQSSRPVAVQVYEPLARHFEAKSGSGAVYMDVHGIPQGVSPRTYLDERVAATELLLAVIEGGWLTEADEHGRRLLDNPDDPVRIEIEAALKRGIPILPVYADGAKPISDADLPDSMKDMAQYGAYNLSTGGSQIAAGMAELTAKLDSYLTLASRLKQAARAAPSAGGNFAGGPARDAEPARHATNEREEAPLDTLALSKADAFFTGPDSDGENPGESDAREAGENTLSAITLASLAAAQDTQPGQVQSPAPRQEPDAQAPEDLGPESQPGGNARAGTAGRNISLSEIASCIDPELVLALWPRLQRGDTSALQPHGLYSERALAFLERVQGCYQAEQDFRAAIEQYLNDSGKVLQEMSRTDPSGRSLQFWLASDNGCAYFVLAHITGRLCPQRAPE
jgi:hypothetical protein